MKELKITFALLIVSLLIISCGGKITNVTLTKVENNKKYKSYMLNYGERPNNNLSYECPWIKDPKNTVFIYMPISFKIENNTGKRIRISQIVNNFSADSYQPIMVDNKYYTYVGGKLYIDSGDQLEVIAFVHLPVNTNLLDKSDYDRYFREPNNRELDSIVMTRFNTELQKAIDKLLSKKDISVYYHDSKDVKEEGLAIYCVKNQKSTTFRMDSLVKLKEPFIYNCN